MGRRNRQCCTRVGALVPVHWASVFASDVARLQAMHPEHVVTSRSLADAPPAQETEVLLVMPTDVVDGQLLGRLPRLKAVITRSDGFDHIDLAACKQHGVRAFHLEGYATESVAQLALTFILAGLRRLPEAHTGTSRGVWDRSTLLGRHLGEVTIGLWGTGRIGGRLAAILSHLGAEVVCHDLKVDAEVAALPGVRYVHDLDALCAQSDVLSLHVPLTDDTRGAMNAQRVARMPPNAIVVNTARGDLIDQEALAAALAGGDIAAYLADVLPNEPTPDLALWESNPKVLITPHLGAHNQQTLEKRYRISGDIARRVLSDVAVPAGYELPS